jgi:hypothetical protein
MPADPAKFGLRGTPQAEIHQVFQTRLAGLRAGSAAAVEALMGNGVRLWDLPTGLVTDLFNISALHKPAHDRETINTNFDKLSASADNAGTTADGIALLYQCDLVASEERALRLRHMSVCRAIAHGAGRRYGLGNGQIFDRMREQAEQMVQAGGGGGAQ